MSKREALSLIRDLEELSILIIVEGDEAIEEALMELEVEDQ